MVLPFTNLSGDPSQDYFADGITENLTTDLSRIRNSFVIARNTAFTFKGKNIDTKEISKELGVRYVLEGSVQRDQNRVRVNAQLIDGETGAHLWADRFEESIADLFKLQDQVVARLANTLGYELVKAEAQKSTHSTNPDAIDLTMRGWAATVAAADEGKHCIGPRLLRARDKDRSAKRRGDGRVGLRAYPRYVLRLEHRGRGYLRRAVGPADEGDCDQSRLCFRLLREEPRVVLTKQFPEAIEAAQTAVALDPNAAYGYFAMGQAEAWLGRCEQSIAHIKQAFALSPRDPIGGVWHIDPGRCRGLPGSA